MDVIDLKEYFLTYDMKTNNGVLIEKFSNPKTNYLTMGRLLIEHFTCRTNCSLFDEERRPIKELEYPDDFYHVLEVETHTVNNKIVQMSIQVREYQVSSVLNYMRKITTFTTDKLIGYVDGKNLSHQSVIFAVKKADELGILRGADQTSTRLRMWVEY